MQLHLFDEAPASLETRTQAFLDKFRAKGLPFDLVAVNMEYEESAVVFDRERDTLRYINIYDGVVKHSYSAPACGQFGSNFVLLDRKYEQYESVRLINDRNEITSCGKGNLARYLQAGWRVKE